MSIIGTWGDILILAELPQACMSFCCVTLSVNRRQKPICLGDVARILHRSVLQLCVVSDQWVWSFVIFLYSVYRRLDGSQLFSSSCLSVMEEIIKIQTAGSHPSKHIVCTNNYRQFTYLIRSCSDDSKVLEYFFQWLLQCPSLHPCILLVPPAVQSLNCFLSLFFFLVILSLLHHKALAYWVV